MKVSWFRRLWIVFAVNLFRNYATRLNNLLVSGIENIPETGGVLIAPNHISAYDTILLPAMVLSRFPQQMLWAPAKEELFRNRIAGWLYRSWGAFPVSRGRDVRAGKRINELLRSEKVMLFPEGTRHKDGVLGKGNRGVGKIIYDTRPVVIPTAIIDLNSWKFPDFAREGRIVFGAPLDFSDLLPLEDCKATHQLIVDRVMAAIADILRREGAYVNPG